VSPLLRSKYHNAIGDLRPAANTEATSAYFKQYLYRGPCLAGSVRGHDRNVCVNWNDAPRRRNREEPPGSDQERPPDQKDPVLQPYLTDAPPLSARRNSVPIQPV
jgi:hypothetical protein